jgi:fructosamine-3-kinase
MERSIARSLEPDLRNACGEALGELSWVRMDWQHGGALTGFSEFTDDTGTHPVFVKFPVPGRELRWTRFLQKTSEPLIIPRLYASGSSLGNHDIAWLVLERLPGNPLGAHWVPGNLLNTARIAARMHAETDKVTVDRPIHRDDWQSLLGSTRNSLRVNRLPKHAQWERLVEEAEVYWDSVIKLWRAREPIGWIHGDLHLANAMRRKNGSLCLVDLAEVRPGHWLEDALYLERMFWAYPDRVNMEDPVFAMMEARESLGLKNGRQVKKLAVARRILLAATTPAFLAHEGTQAHLNACLRVLGSSLAWWSDHGVPSR